MRGSVRDALRTPFPRFNRRIQRDEIVGIIGPKACALLSKSFRARIPGWVFRTLVAPPEQVEDVSCPLGDSCCAAVAGQAALGTLREVGALRCTVARCANKRDPAKGRLRPRRKHGWAQSSSKGTVRLSQMSNSNPGKVYLTPEARDKQRSRKTTGHARRLGLRSGTSPAKAEKMRGSFQGPTLQLLA
ncbi:hypothetical protein BCV69DRAFT_87840 [Microstroma glucosiphilum]|uniref:Uncharacterized protein n=1 Tax=Pseudomicrostroma glucosiphilum TaxID=1684307 RepID=A0A316TWP4_9BASI|nr:hypothetical protein BCV69DRAFT_87840 [Pseudomicrostroma glucosiphilum]PWN17892.1 hypothetical protein BCV69DRAFT_87840 [Pseudomicrostroma glucosiphilum]